MGIYDNALEFQEMKLLKNDSDGINDIYKVNAKLKKHRLKSAFRASVGSFMYSVVNRQNVTCDGM